MNAEKEKFKKEILDYEQGVKDWCIVDNKNMFFKPIVDKAFENIKMMKRQYKNMSDLETKANDNRKIYLIDEVLK